MKINKKIGIIIQARSSSSRLNKKFKRKINKNSLLIFLIKRIINFKDKFNIIIAIPKNDKLIYSHIKGTKNLKIFKGNNNNVLDRYYKCCLKYKLNTIIRLTGDNPLVDLNLVTKYLKKHLIKKKIFTSNCYKSTFPNGLEFEIIDKNLLELAWKKAKLKSDKEHVTPFIYRLIQNKKISKKKLLLIYDKLKYNHLRFTVDKIEDLIVVKKIYRELKINNLKINYPNIIKIFKKNKKIFHLNQNEIRNEGYLLSLKKDYK